MVDEEQFLLGCKYAAAAAIRSGKTPTPTVLFRLLEEVEHRLAVARSRHELAELASEGGQSESDDELIDVTEAGRIIGWSPRTMQRRADEFGGVRVGGVYVFRRAVVERHARGRKNRNVESRSCG